jgi:3D (Asp-Asp-Asp) domain-containing protein
MKHLFIIIGFIAVLTSEALAGEQSLLARITVYWHGESGDHASWNGARLQPGHCAVDPKRIPYGSKVLFPDAACVAVDTGPDVVNRKAARSTGRTVSQRAAIVIDRYFETKQQALSWARTHPYFMMIRVVTRDLRSLSTRHTQAGASVPAYLAPVVHEMMSPSLIASRLPSYRRKLATFDHDAGEFLRNLIAA